MHTNSVMWRALCIGAALLLVATAAAKDKHEKWSGERNSPVVVLAHLDIGSGYDAMALQKSQDHRYLYIRQSGKPELEVIDLTAPAEPRVLRTVSLPELREFASLDFDGGVAFGSEDKRQVSDAQTPTRDVVFSDLSDPESLQSVQKFTGVKQVINDRLSDLVYILAENGLWILRVQAAPAPVDPSLYGGGG